MRRPAAARRRLRSSSILGKATQNTTKLTSSDIGVVTWTSTDAEADLESDPVLPAIDPKYAGCVTASEQLPESAWKWSVPDEGTTLLGLPDLEVDYVLAGTTGTLAPKLWDEAPDGTRTLVSRGVYRVDAPDSLGTLSFRLFGNHWHFPAGHKIVLELSGSDAPFLHPANLPFAVTVTRVRLTLPRP